MSGSDIFINTIFECAGKDFQGRTIKVELAQRTVSSFGRGGGRGGGGGGRGTFNQNIHL